MDYQYRPLHINSKGKPPSSVGILDGMENFGKHDFMIIQWRYENLLAIAEYISANPVRKGLAATPKDWPWSAD